MQDHGRSLTPYERREEAVSAALNDGIWSGVCALIPSSASVWYFMKTSPTFKRSTNWQSRTALVIMPPLFVFGIASELKVSHKMNDMANEIEHSTKVTEWAENQKRTGSGIFQNHRLVKGSIYDDEKRLHEIYKTSVANSGVRVVPGETLGIHHKVANFWQENPFKILTAVSVPAVLYIFKGKTGQQHLQLQSMLMHTRVYGQFTVIIFLLGLMGFKGYMDANGKFITEADSDRRVEDMQYARRELLVRLETDNEQDKKMEDLLKIARGDTTKKVSRKKDDLLLAGSPKIE